MELKFIAFKVFYLDDGAQLSLKLSIYFDYEVSILNSTFFLISKKILNASDCDTD